MIHYWNQDEEAFGRVTGSTFMKYLQSDDEYCVKEFDSLSDKALGVCNSDIFAYFRCAV